MAASRRVAVMVGLDGLGPRERAAWRGVERFVREARHWRVAVDPFAASHPVERYDGVIALSHAAQASARPPAGVPVVAVSHACWHRRTISRVVPNLRTAGRLLAEHLLKCGFLQYACLACCPDQPSRLLREGFDAKISRAGFSRATLLVHPRSLRKPDGWAGLHETVGEWLDRSVRWPTGVLVSTVPLARAFADLCVRKGLRIPDEIAIVAPGDEPDLVEFPPPALTTIDLGYERCGYHAAELLEEQMEAGAVRPCRVLLLPGEVTGRRSTEAVTWHDALVQRACRYIADHCGERLRVGDVAAAVGASVRTLQRRFRYGHERSLREEVAHARVQVAMMLLLSTELSVAEVTRRAGLSSARRLSRLLRRETGLSPSEYRWVRPRRREPGAPDIEKAKRLLATTDRPVGTVALDAGYRAHRYLIAAFHREVGMTPRAWRRTHRGRTPTPRARPVQMVFIGPDGREESDGG